MILKNQLLKAKDSKLICSVFWRNDLECGCTGIIKWINEDVILLKRINADGCEDGYLLGKMEDVVCCSTGDMELLRRQRLYREEDTNEKFVSGQKKEIISEIYKYMMQQKYLVSVIYFEQDFSGWIQNFSDEIVVLNECTRYGEADGEVWLKREWIDAIEIETQELKIREKLHRSHASGFDLKIGKNFYECLKEYERKDEIFEFHIEDDLEKFCVGGVERITEKEIIIKCIDRDGYDDGYAIFSMDQIRCIYRRGMYLNKINKIRKNGSENLALTIESDALFDGFLQYAQKCHSIIMLDMVAQYYYGKVMEWDAEYICLTVTDEYGREDGEIWVLRECIKTMCIYSQSLKNIC